MKYFIEHKKSKKWISISYWGEDLLTTDPNEAMSFDYDFDAKRYIEGKMKPTYSGNFSGTAFRQNNQISITVQNMIYEGLKKLGFDLFNDFEVTEHEFVSDAGGTKI